MSCTTPLLSACQLASMRSAVEGTFTQDVQLQSQTNVVDALGGHSQVWTDVGAKIMGRLVVPKMQQKGIADKLREVDVFELKLPWNIEVLPSYRAIVSGAGTYSVEGSDAGRPDLLQLTAMVRRVR